MVLVFLNGGARESAESAGEFRLAFRFLDEGHGVVSANVESVFSLEVDCVKGAKKIQDKQSAAIGHGG